VKVDQLSFDIILAVVINPKSQHPAQLRCSWTHEYCCRWIRLLYLPLAILPLHCIALHQ